MHKLKKIIIINLDKIYLLIFLILNIRFNLNKKVLIKISKVKNNSKY